MAIIWAVGDCGTGWDSSKSVGTMIANDKPDRFLYLGDVYDSGQPDEYQNRYDPVFGSLKSITSPIPGNHDYMSNLVGWKSYWGNQPTYYNFEIDGWQFIMLDSEADHSPSSKQIVWLNSLVNKNKPTVLAIHRHRYSAGGHGDQPDIEPFISHFKNAIVLSGHSHVYQRMVYNKMTHFVIASCGQPCVQCNPRNELKYWTCEIGALRIEILPYLFKFEYRTPNGNILDSGEIKHLPIHFL